MSSSSSELYRPDIDGLRAIAVLMVLFYHADVPYFSGGYVGVDVFFVISGFLITRLLINELDAKKEIDFAGFFNRRVRRLFPAFFFMLIFTSLLAFFLFSPFELISYASQLISSSLNLSNIYFLITSGYFDADYLTKPLLHTWSLCVEVQFYLVWPFIIGFLYSRKILNLTSIILIGLCSFCFAKAFLEAHTTAVFFLMPFRIFEFCMGACLIWPIRNNYYNKYLAQRPLIKEFLLLVGLIIVLYPAFAYNKATTFPGFGALLPCLGAALCIYAGDTHFLGKLLRNKLLVGIGLLSYSLYLVHWPLIVFYKHQTGRETLSSNLAIAIIGLSLLFGLVMYRYVEVPSRKYKFKKSTFLFLYALLTLLLNLIGASMFFSGGFNWRKWSSIGSIKVEDVQIGKESRFKVRQNICTQKGWEACDDVVLGATNVLIMGDSHAVDALNAFYKVYPAHNYSMSQLNGCPPYHSIEEITSANHPDRIKCKILNKERYDPSYLRQFDYIVINVLYDWYTFEHLFEYLQFLKFNNVQKVIIMGNYLVLNRDMPELINKYGYNKQQITPWVRENIFSELRVKSRVNEFGYLYISKKDKFCHNKECEYFDSNQVPFTFDKHHLSYEFAAQLLDDIHHKIDKYLGLKDGPAKKKFMKKPA